MDANKTTTLSFQDFDFSVILYSLAALLIGGGGSYYILKSERQITAIGFFLASLAIFVYFGLRWFDGLKLRPSISGVMNPATSWPPVINYCPDFLSLKQVGSDFYCVDTTGVSKLNTFTQMSVPDANNSLQLVQNRTAQQYVTSNFLSGNTTGLTWEGIYDGRSPSDRVPPYPTTA